MGLARQREIFSQLIKRGAETRFGRDHGFGELVRLPFGAAYRRYRSVVPIRSYEDFWRDYFSHGFREADGRRELILRDVTWPGLITRFCETSGTTAPTKYIPFTDEMFAANRRAALDLISSWLLRYPSSRLLSGDFVYLSGSTILSSLGEGITSGDMSAITLRHAPWYLRPFLAHGPELGDLPWQEKVDRLARLIVSTRSVTGISGVPPWIIQLLRRCREVGKAPLSELLPNLELIIHGGTSFLPYRQEFRDLFEDGPLPVFLEVYPASEGFIGFQPAGSTQLRMTPWYGVFFEFVPVPDGGDEGSLDPSRAVTLQQVTEGVRYAIVMSSCAGLWRYRIGDTIRILSRETLAIEFTGRDRCLDRFEEKITQYEIERAVQSLEALTGVGVTEFMVGPEIPTRRHLWILAVEGQRPDPLRVGRILDDALRRGNADYDAFRLQERIARPLVVLVDRELFYVWSERVRGKVGGQTKIPRIDPTPDGEFVRSLAASA